MKLLVRSALRDAARHPGQAALTVLGVALGVAVALGVDLAVDSARQAFRLSAEAVAGRATHHVVGGPGGLADDVFRAVRVDAGVRASAPVVEGWAEAAALPGVALRVLGVDPLSEGAVRPWLGGTGGDAALDPTGLVAAPGAVLLVEATARDAGLAPGDTLRLTSGGRTRAVVVAGLLAPSDGLAREGLRDVVVADIALAQEVLDRVGRLSRIDLALPEGPGGAAALERVRAAVPPGVRVETAGARADTLAGMIGAFDLNLTALSLLALVFGMFLVYNATTFSVVRRRESLGTLRALGVTRREVLGLLLAESAALAAAGTALGLALGVALAGGLVRLVTRTINDLYFVVTVREVAVTPGALATGVLLGVGGALLATLPPAHEATSRPPRATLARAEVEAGAVAAVPRAALAGVLLLALGAALLLPPGPVLRAFAGLFAVVLGTALLTPLGTVAAMRVARPLAGAGVGILGTMAARGVVRSLSRTAPAVASLVVAVSVTVGLGVMIDSFRSTVGRWLDRTLQADVYVALPATVANRAEGTLDPALVERLASAPGVVGVSRYRNVPLPREGGEARLVALELDPRGEDAFTFAEGEAGAALARFRSGEGVLVSEPFAFREGVGVGDTVRLAGDRGEAALAVAGVFYDYGSDRGVVMMDRRLYDRLHDDRGVTSLGLFLPPDADREAEVAALRRRVAGAGQAVTIRSNRALRDASLEVFDRTFAITAVLRALAFVVAFIGVLGALMALQLERARELGVLRANGLTPGQVWALVTSQTGLLGLAAGLMAVPAGVLLAWIMIDVVNRRSFGWTVVMELPAGVFLQAVGLALAGALLAGLYPAWRMARTPPALALREE